MTKAELVALMAKAAGSSQRPAEKAMRAFVTAVFDALRREKRVTLSGFGTFAVGKRQARAGRNPRTGKAILIPPARVPRFRPSRGLKSAVR
jgi:DNA-binding protein HU-beta